MSGELTTIAAGVAAWLGGGAPGDPNAGLIIETDGVTLVDTLMVASQWEPLGDAVDAIGAPLRRVVLTSSHIPFVGGTGRFWQAAFYGTQHTSDMLELPPNVEGYRRLYPAYASEFDDELRTRPVSHTVTIAAYLTHAVLVLPVVGHSRENLVVHLPESGVLFAGATASFGTTPLAFDGDPAAWAGTCRELAELVGPGTVVPGHGPLGGASDLLVLADYLTACAAGRIPPGPWDGWRNREFDQINLERAALLARGQDVPPPSFLRLLGLA